VTVKEAHITTAAEDVPVEAMAVNQMLEELQTEPPLELLLIVAVATSEIQGPVDTVQVHPAVFAAAAAPL